MTEIEIKAIKAYSVATLSEKILLNTLFGQDLFLDNEFEIFCKENTINYQEFIDKYSILDDNGLANEMLKVIIKITNKGWAPDWLNISERKYYPYFEYTKGAGFGFSGTYYGYTVTSASTASRLCFKNEIEAKSIAIRFIKIYNKLLN